MAKQAKSAGPGIPVLGPIFGLLFGPRMAPLLAIGGLLAVGGYWAWSQMRGAVVAEPHYQVTLESVVVSPLPEWIKSDVKGEALRDASLDLPLSVLDEDLVERLAKAFSFHPWVAEVKQVRKEVPARITVDLVYRRPVCMVELPDRTGLYAVDVAAFLLPSKDFLQAPQQAARYPRLSGITSVNVGRVGVRWPDPFVQGGVRVAAVLDEAWGKLNFARIIPSETADTGNASPQFEVVTRGGTRVIWGSAPGMEAGAEARYDSKLASLLRYAADHKTLEGRDGPQRLDVRSRDVVVLAALPKQTAAKPTKNTAKSPSPK